MADTLDVLTLAEARLAINEPSGHDAVIAQMVTAISRRIDELCGPVVKRAVTELHNGSCTSLWPRETPVYAVTTLTEYAYTAATVLSAESNATKPADAYMLDSVSTHNVRIYRRASGSDTRFASGRNNVELVYEAGRYAATASVDAKFKEAAGEILRRLRNREAGAWARGGDPFTEAGGTPGFFKAVDPMVREFLGYELLPPAVA